MTRKGYRQRRQQRNFPLCFLLRISLTSLLSLPVCLSTRVHSREARSINAELISTEKTVRQMNYLHPSRAGGRPFRRSAQQP